MRSVRGAFVAGVLHSACVQGACGRIKTESDVALRNLVVCAGCAFECSTVEAKRASVDPYRLPQEADGERRDG